MPAKTKNILLVGMTQNGKSSLVREILRYSGDTARADTVQVGDGNVSQTQHCSTYDVRVPRKQHYLRDIESKKPVEANEDIDPDEVEECEISSGSEYFRLRVIDTPGLGESRNSGAETAEEDRTFVDDEGNPVQWRLDGSNMKTADERHKISIIQALRSVGTINAVCLVIKNEPFSKDLQRMITSVQEIFRPVSPNAWGLDYHIVHTSVGKRQRFSNYCQIREREFRQVFVGMRSTHHFLDNKPHVDDAVSCHFAKTSLASLLFMVAQGRSFDVGNLRYLKTGAHMANDAQLCSGLRHLKHSYESDLQRLSSELSISERQRDAHESQLRFREKTLNDTCSRIRELDSSSPVQCGSKSETARTWSQTWSGLLIEVSSDYLIKKVEYEPGPNYFSDNSEGDYRVSAKLRSPSGVFTQTGTITVYTHRRIKETKTLERLKEQERTQRQAKETSESCFEKARDEVVALRNQISTLRAQLSTILRAESLTQGRFFPQEIKIQDLFYFTVNSCYAAAQGYTMKGQIPKSRLPKINVSNATCISEIQSQKTQRTSTLQTRKTILASLRHTLSQRTALAKTLLSMAENTALLHQAQKQRGEALDNSETPFTSTPNPASSFSSSSSTSAPSRKESTRLKTLANRATTALSHLQDSESAHLHAHALLLREASEQIGRSVQKLSAAAAHEARQIERLELWLVAAERVVEIVKGWEGLDLGAFVVVERAVGLRVRNPYLVLWLEVWEGLRAERGV